MIDKKRFEDMLLLDELEEQLIVLQKKVSGLRRKLKKNNTSRTPDGKTKVITELCKNSK
jgi:hypothetical protein